MLGELSALVFAGWFTTWPTGLLGLVIVTAGLVCTPLEAGVLSTLRYSGKGFFGLVGADGTGTGVGTWFSIFCYVLPLFVFVSDFTGVTGVGSWGTISDTGSRIFCESGLTIIWSTEFEFGGKTTGWTGYLPAGSAVTINVSSFFAGTMSWLVGLT